jgi:hypothetical protein
MCVKEWCRSVMQHPETVFGDNYEAVIDARGKVPIAALIKFMRACSKWNGYWYQCCKSVEELIRTDPDCTEGDPELARAMEALVQDRVARDKTLMPTIIRFRHKTLGPGTLIQAFDQVKEAESKVMRNRIIELASRVLDTAGALHLLAEKRFHAGLEQLTPAKLEEETKESQAELVRQVNHLIVCILASEGEISSLMVRAQALKLDIEENSEPLDSLHGRYGRLETQVTALAVKNTAATAKNQ